MAKKQISVGVDIGGTNTVYGLVNKEGEILESGTFPTIKFPDFDEYLEELYIGIVSLFKKLDPEKYELCGIGIGAPNSNYHTGTIENAANLVWGENIPIVEKLRRYFPTIPITLTNDAKAAAIGEMMYGKAKGMKDFLVVTLGTGLGSGFVSNGKPIYGFDGFAGEFGHAVVDRSASARQCGCGRKGCLEAYCSASGIVRTLFQLMLESTDDNIFRTIPFNEVTTAMISKEAEKGNPLAIKTYEQTGLILGQALADAVTVCSPEAIFLFGGVTNAGNILFDPIKKYMEMNLFPAFRNKILLAQSGLMDTNAAILGASALIWAEIEQ